jgi:hypothetical protein
MILSASQARSTASKVAQWLLDKERPDDAVQLLSAWAAQGPNDAEGQQLMAEALRIDPNALVAKQAFERMEAIAHDHPVLDASISRFDEPELLRLEAEMKRPVFLRAQVGFNNNVKYKGGVFHIQTEDSGLLKPHVITHLFADGGRVVKSHKRSYADLVNRPDVATYVRSLMKGQQLEMALGLREGRFDEIIAGRAVGGMELLEHPPKVDVQHLATKKHQTMEAKAVTVTVTPAPALAKPLTVHPPDRPSRPPVRLRVHVLRSLFGGPPSYECGDTAVLGSAGSVALPGERFCHPREAAIRYTDGRVWLEDFEAGNGVFLRIRAPAEISWGDEFLVGDQLFRLERNPLAIKDGPDPGPTYFYSSPKWMSSFRVVQIFEGGALGACLVARGNTMQIGSVLGDLLISDDVQISDQHCVIEEQAGAVILRDLESRSGVFVRIKGVQELVDGDELVVGRTRLLVEVPRSEP